MFTDQESIKHALKCLTLKFIAFQSVQKWYLQTLNQLVTDKISFTFLPTQQNNFSLTFISYNNQQKSVIVKGHQKAVSSCCPWVAILYLSLFHGEVIYLSFQVLFELFSSKPSNVTFGNVALNLSSWEESTDTKFSLALIFRFLKPDIFLVLWIAVKDRAYCLVTISFILSFLRSKIIK